MQLKEEKMPKSQLRAHFSNMQKGLSADFRQKMNYEIQSRLLCSFEYSQADMILTYVSVGCEADTLGIIHAAFANGKKVAVPKCLEGNTMEFYFIKSERDLVKGKFSLLEPDISKCKKAVPTEKSLCIVPGLSFDAKGYRLGKGGGYYDRFLKDFKGKSAGLCYNSFLRLSLPKEPFDVPVDIIVTENFLRETNS